MNNSRKITTFNLDSQEQKFFIKYSEFLRKVKKGGWKHIRTEGSHYIYEKNGRTYPVPFHGAKEIPEGLRKKIVKELELQCCNNRYLKK